MVVWLLIYCLTISGGVGVEDKIAAISGVWMEHPNPPHPYASNMWWRMTNHTAKVNDHKDCYVCAHFPHSTSGEDWYAHQDFGPKVLQAIMTVTVAAAGMPENSTVWVHQRKGKKGKKGNTRSCWSDLETVKRVAGRVATSKTMPTNMTCFQSDYGVVNLGKIPSSRCSKIYVSHSTNQATRRNCVLCLTQKSYYEGNLKQSDTALNFLVAKKKDSGRCRLSGACDTVYIPDNEGTGVVKDIYWLCGYAIYVSLPRDWRGICAPIQLHGGAIIIPVTQQSLGARFKRGLKDLFITSPVPANHRLWSTAEKVASSIFPLVGVASLMQEVEVTRYALISFMQTTTLVLKKFTEELGALRLTAIQNRIVLDQLTASQGGVCMLIGESCCTYVPEFDEDGHIIQEGIHNLTLLAKTLNDWRVDTSGSFGFEWLKGLFTSWKHGIACVLIGCVLIGILLVLCFGPCMYRCILKTVQRQLPKCINEILHFELYSSNAPQQDDPNGEHESATSSEGSYEEVASINGPLGNQ